MRTYSRLPQVTKCIGVVLILAACRTASPTPAPASLTPAPVLEPTLPPTPTPAPATYWPTQGWRTSTPEQQGMDSARLVEMLDTIQEQHYPIHGIVIVRNGYIVTEAYFHPYQAESRHYIASATKSFTSALIGIAIEQGYIDGVDQKLLDFFPGRTAANVDSQKQAITLEHLLTMSSGLDWPTQGLTEELWPEVEQSQDWTQFVLDRPMAQEPGTHFVYNSGGSHLLSAMIWQTTGKQALSFAQGNLFSHLGITDVEWAADPMGVNVGSGGLEMLPRDIAKFGYLYLNKGAWDGLSIVPAEWVEASTSPHMNTGYMNFDYGYQWWVAPSGVYSAHGYGGQRIFVAPEQALVVVMVCGFPATDVSGMESVPEELLESFIIPAAVSTVPLPPNPEQAALLESRQYDLAHPEPQPVPPLPAMAQSVSGRIYTVQSNSLSIKAFTLHFSEGTESEAVINISNEFGLLDLPIGLDGVYRHKQSAALGSPPSIYALKGSWIGDDTFVINAMEEGVNIDMQITFQAEGSGIEANIVTPWYQETVTGEALPDLSESGETLNYLLYLPDEYGQEPDQQWPLILFLHGIGERGSDLELLKKHALPRLIEEGNDYPFIIVSPQCPIYSEWDGQVTALAALLEDIQAEYAVDPGRIYVTGLSMGGYGTWAFASAYPDIPAAIVPVASFYNDPLTGVEGGVPTNICDLKDIPTWVFHGGRDEVFDKEVAEVIIEALEVCGGEPRYTLYPDADHEATFNNAYTDPELFEWLLAQSK